MTREKHYQHGNGLVRLRPSRRMFILRLRRRADLPEILQDSLGQDWSLRFRVVDEFTEARVWVLRIQAGVSATVGSIKDEVRATAHPGIDYIGTLWIDKATGRYQIYTGNLFLCLDPLLDRSECHALLEMWRMKIKKILGFCVNAYFVEPIHQEGGLDAFYWAQRLQHEPQVQEVQPELVANRCVGRKVPEGWWLTRRLNRDWVHQMVRLPEAWRLSQGRGSKICVIDDGIDAQHRAFGGPEKIVAAKDMLEADNLSASHRFSSEVHGTACASVALSCDPAAMGAAPMAQLIPVRCKGLGSILEAEAIAWAVRNGADVISCSWGPTDGSIEDPNDDFRSPRIPRHTQLALEYASRHGRGGLGSLVVFAAGNGNELVDLDSYASNPHVLAVGAVNRKGEKSLYSDYGDALFCVYPSSGLRKTRQGFEVVDGVSVADRTAHEGYTDHDYYHSFGGTSASAPGVAGVAALALSLDPLLTLSELRSILKDSCQKIGDSGLYGNKGKSRSFGYGLLDAYEVARRADESRQARLSGKDMSATRNSEHIDIQGNQGYAIHIGVDRTDPDVYDNFQDLSGCVADAEALAKITTQEGYQVEVLRNQDATRAGIRQKLLEYARRAEEGDIVVISYAGHGSSIPALYGDELRDEVLVTYDGFLVDDEIHDLLCNFVKGVRVVWIADCCHADTNTRSPGSIHSLLGANVKERSLHPRVARAVLEANEAQYRQARSAASTRAEIEPEAAILALYACAEHQTAKEIDGRGLFTGRVEVLYDDEGRLTLAESKNELMARLPAMAQDPKMSVQPEHEHLFRHGIFKVQLPPGALEAKGAEPLLASLESSLKEDPIHPLTGARRRRKVPISVHGELESLKLFMEGERGNARQELLRIVDSEVQIDRPAEVSSWDIAYKIAQRAVSIHDLEFVEPDVESDLYAFPHDLATQQRGERSSGGSYLSTYPNPEHKKYRGKCDPYTWHLDEEYSQLNAAFIKVIQANLKNEPRDVNDAKTQGLPLICHIDTGVFSDHPSLPLFFDARSSLTMHRYSASRDFEDHDRRYAMIENQGHGHGTISILAGNYVEDWHTNGEFIGYCGAFPYARVMTVKISEHVALLCGRKFARAIDHAIDRGASVVTMSMAGAPTRRMLKAINKAYEAGVVVVAAAGNSWVKGAMSLLPERTMYPARFNRVIGVTGATLDHRPYLVKENKDWRSREVGGEFMQSCFGPKAVNRTNIAAYTPNVRWAGHFAGGAFFDRSGGGTSSATPQVAAAVAMWMFHYRDELARYEPIRRAEMARQAIFRSARKSFEKDSYLEVFGQGTLRALEALKLSPSALAQVEPEPKDEIEGPVFFRFLKQLFNRGGERSGDQPNQDVESRVELLSQMLAMELEQLRVLDPKFYSISEDVGNKELFRLIYASEHASELLKACALAQTRVASREEPRGYAAHGVESFRAYSLSFADDVVGSIESKGAQFTFRPDLSEVAGDSVQRYAIELEPSKHASDDAPELRVQLHAGDRDTVALLSWSRSEHNGRAFRWLVGRRGQDGLDLLRAPELRASVTTSRASLESEDSCKRYTLRLYRDAQASEGEPVVGQRSSRGIAWRAFEENDAELLASQSEVLVCISGSFLSLEQSFLAYGGQGPGAERVFSAGSHSLVVGFELNPERSVQENARKLHDWLAKQLPGDLAARFRVVAHGVGCLVARLAFEKGTPMALIAGMHHGSGFADEGQCSALLPRATSLGYESLAQEERESFLLGMSKLARTLFHGSIPLFESLRPELFELLNNEYSIDSSQLLVGSRFNPRGRVSAYFGDTQGPDSGKHDGLIDLSSSLAANDPGISSNLSFVPLGGDLNHFSLLRDDVLTQRVLEHLFSDPATVQERVNRKGESP